MRQSGGRINNPHGGREHGKEKIIKGYVLDVETVEKTLRAKERDMGRVKKLKRARRYLRSELERELREVGRYPFRDRLRLAWRILRGDRTIVFRKE